ncbi:MAG TPA: hypothetical protein VIL42_10710 [Sphingomicrobium sp.]
MIGWEQHCADVAAAHVKAETGRDIWAELGGAPRNAREAAELYRKLKARTLKSAVSKALGTKAHKPLMAMRGDLVLVKSGELSALGICRGDLIECADNMLPMSRAECCWKVSRFRE